VRLAPFFAVLVQFGLIVTIVDYWQLESLSLARLMQLTFVGFVIHHLLPLRFRLPFFALLSVLSITVGVGHLGPKVLLAWLAGRITTGSFFYHFLPGLALTGIGLTLIGLCHLPIRFWARVGLVAAAGTGLVLLRANSQWFPDVAEIWVILGSMFAFRLIVYLYDLKHRTAPFSLSRALSYFFMLPNVCFPLFPVVDYKTFCSTYYNEDPIRIYQTGLRWMIRGVVQLLLYRIVYQLAPLDITKLSSALDAVEFMVATYLLYLRVSGTFHLIVGLLHMFGFNLPETHHLYLLASSFTDLWRRINIYWKDFVMKLFFYPTHFALRKIGMLRAIAVATLVTFFATWLLHSWQWFWIRGSPLLAWQDISFWAILAALVLVNGLYEATLGQRRTLAKSRITMGERLIRGLQTVGTFIAICTLWTIWSSHSWGELQALADAISRPTPREMAIVLVGLVTIGASGMVWGRSSRETSEGRIPLVAREPFHFWRSTVVISLGAIILLAGPSVITRAIPRTQNIVARLHNDVLNARDIGLQRRGYYEELDVNRGEMWQWRGAEDPEGWKEGNKVFFRTRSDFLLRDIVPSVSSIQGGVPATSNRWGMRDRGYERVKPTNTYRIVLVGASHDMGIGVKDDQTYENLVEDRLNHLPPDARYSQYEILNMSVAGYSILQRLLHLEQEGFEFQPDAVMLSIAAADWQFLPAHLRKALIQGIDPPPGYREIVESVVRRAHVNGKMPDVMIERRLQPYVPEILQWAFRRFAQQCAQRGVRPLVIYRPAPVDFEGSEHVSGRQIIQSARVAGLELIDLSPAFDSVVDRSKLTIAKWDDHTTALGHRLLADELYKDLVPLLFGSPGKQQTSLLQKP
jgi:hypothetical protein